MNNWDDIDHLKIITGDTQEINRLYFKLKNGLMDMTKQNEELSHDIFLKIVYKMDKYNPERSKLHNFIYTIGINELRTYMKIKNSRMPDIEFMDCFPSDYEDNISETESSMQSDFFLNTKDKKCLNHLKQKIGKLQIETKDKRFLLKYFSLKRPKTRHEVSRFTQIKRKLIQEDKEKYE